MDGTEMTRSGNVYTWRQNPDPRDNRRCGRIREGKVEEEHCDKPYQSVCRVGPYECKPKGTTTTK